MTRLYTVDPSSSPPAILTLFFGDVDFDLVLCGRADQSPPGRRAPDLPAANTACGYCGQLGKLSEVDLTDRLSVTVSEIKIFQFAAVAGERT